MKKKDDHNTLSKMVKLYGKVRYYTALLDEAVNEVMQEHALLLDKVDRLEKEKGV